MDPLKVEEYPALGDSFLSSKYFNPDYLFNRGYEFFRDIFNFSVNNNSLLLSAFHTILFILALFFITLTSYCVVRMFEIRAKERKHLHHEIEEYAHHQKEREKKKKEEEEISKNPQWIKTLNFLFSQHSSNWKLAIIEADSMLFDLMGQLGFKGESLGDRLKAADQNTFRELTSAWEVHTIRNRIAHEGLSYEISQHEAKRVISLYEDIFRAYGFI